MLQYSRNAMQSKLLISDQKTIERGEMLCRPEKSFSDLMLVSLCALNERLSAGFQSPKSGKGCSRTVTFSQRSNFS